MFFYMFLLTSAGVAVGTQMLVCVFLFHGLQRAVPQIYHPAVLLPEHKLQNFGPPPRVNKQPLLKANKEA